MTRAHHETISTDAQYVLRFFPIKATAAYRAEGDMCIFSPTEADSPYAVVLRVSLLDMLTWIVSDYTHRALVGII